MAERMRRKAGLSLALALALAACDMAPKHVRPALPVAPAFPADTTRPTGDAHAIDIGWRDFFVDPQLKILIATALEHNRDLAVSVARIEEARGQYRIQNAERLPELDANGGYTRSRVGAASLSAQGAVPAGKSGIEYNSYSFGAGVSSFELDFWGRLHLKSAPAMPLLPPPASPPTRREHAHLSRVFTPHPSLEMTCSSRVCSARSGFVADLYA